MEKFVKHPQVKHYLSNCITVYKNAINNNEPVHEISNNVAFWHV